MQIVAGVVLVLCLWATFSLRFHRMVTVSAAAVFPLLLARLATVFTETEDRWFTTSGPLAAWMTAGVAFLIGLRWLNHYAPGPGVADPAPPTTGEATFARFIAAAYGILAALALFIWAAWWLQGQPNGFLWHAAFAAGAIAALLGAAFLRHRLVAWLLAPAGLVILSLAGWGALVFPGIVRDRAEQWAQRYDGHAFCFAAPRVEVGAPDYEGRLERGSGFSSWPREPKDLSLLTIAKPFWMVVENPTPELARDFSRDETDVWKIHLWEPFALDFTAWDDGAIFEHRPAIFVDCIPRADYLLQSDKRDQHEGIVLSQPLLAEVGIQQTWGTLIRDVFVVPAALQPRFRRRFSDEVRLDILAPLLQGQAPLWVSLHYWHHPEVEVGRDAPIRYHGVADPGDLARWQPNPLGLVDLYPKSRPGDGSFAAYRPDGRIKSYIWCNYGRCAHSFIPETPLWKSDIYFRTGYSIDLLPQWQTIEAAALAQFLALRQVE